jgi:hypothetical protein
MELVLIIVTITFSILCLFVEPLIPTKNKFIKRWGSKILLILVVVSGALSIAVYFKNEKKEAIKLHESEIDKLRRFPLGTGYEIKIIYKKEIPQFDMFTSTRMSEIDRYMAEDFKNFQDTSKFETDLRMERKDEYYKFLMDSLSRYSLFKTLSSAQPGNIFFSLNIEAGGFASSTYMFSHGLFDSKIQYIPLRDSPIVNGKKSNFYYRKTGMDFLGAFETPLDAAALYQSLIKNLSPEQNRSSVIFRYSTINPKIISETRKFVANIDKIQILIDSNPEASRYFLIELKPTGSDSVSPEPTGKAMIFPIEFVDEPSEQYIDSPAM